VRISPIHHRPQTIWDQKCNIVNHDPDLRREAEKVFEASRSSQLHLVFLRHWEVLSSSGLLEHNEDPGEHDRSPGVGVGGGDLDALPAVGVWNKPITIAAQK